MHLLGIAGSLRAGSYNRRLLLAAARVVPAGTTFEISRPLDLIPAYDEDLDTDAPPAAVAELRTAIARADAVLLATPEYNASPPGHLKNALDWASRPYATNALRDRPTAVVGASTGSSGAVRAQAELRRVLRATGAQVLDGELAVSRAAAAFDATGGLADPTLAAALRALVRDLVALAYDARRDVTAGPDAHPRAAA